MQTNRLLRAGASMMAVALAAGIVAFAGITSRATGDIPIDAAHFPDEAFRKHILEHCDNNYDEVLSSSEIEHITQIWWVDAEDRVSDLTGIEYFTSLEDLSVYNHKLTKLDVSKNTKLKRLMCYNNQLTSLNISGCKDLETLYCGGNKLKSLDLKGFTALSSLDCDGNPMTSIDLSGCTALDRFTYESGQLEKVNLSGCTSLKYLDLSRNKISSLNLTGCTAIASIECDENNLAAIDLKDCKDLDVLDIDQNKLTSLNLGNNTVLREVNCSKNKIKDLVLSSSLEVLECNENSLTSLDLSACKKLTAVYCSDNQLTSLKTDGCTELNTLFCSSNKLKSIDISKNTSLYELRCDDNQISSLDLGKNTNLANLDCSKNLLDKLDISKCKMWVLRCGENKFKKLDYSKYTSLFEVDCRGNALLTEVNLSGCTSLQTLNCSGCALTSLNIRDSIQVNVLDCSKNQLESIDLSSCEELLLAFKEGKRTLSDGDKVATYIYDTNTYDDDGCYNDDGIYAKLVKDVKTLIVSDALKLDKTEANIICGKTLTLKASLDGKATEATWITSDKKIATVDSNGKITAKMAGKVTITAYVSGASANCTVTVLYKDVTNSKEFWYKPTNYLTANGIVKGYDKQTKFKPANECTRAQMVTVLWRLAGQPEPHIDTCRFPDVKAKDYFYKPVIWAVERGITTGYGDGTFKPQNVCTRAQTVTFLWRMAGKPDPKTSKNKFSDVKKKDYFYTPVLWASEMKIVEGYKDGTFKPQGKCLRRQMVTFLYKYDKYVNGKG
ncbi:MAG: S-layer homology domain-containing protein [Clostridiales bacterium]|nr:S-layer homology domain-containing protein [Clostridiales bacterium]